MPIEIPEITPCTVVSIFAPVRSGKSYLLKRLIDKQERSITWDISLEFSEPEYEHVYASPVVVCDRLIANPYYYRIAYHAGTDREWEFDIVASALWQYKIPRWLVIDECVELCGHGIHPKMDLALRQGRKPLLGVIACTQRIAEIDKLLTSCSNKVIIFHTTESRDEEAIDVRFGRQVLLAMEKLRPLIYDDATREVHQTPQCLVYDVPSKQFRIHSLGDKVKSTDEGEAETWQDTAVERRKQEVQSSGQPSGSPELGSEPYTSELGKAK